MTQLRTREEFRNLLSIERENSNVNITIYERVPKENVFIVLVHLVSILLRFTHKILGKVLRKLHVFDFSPRWSLTPPFESSCTQRDQRRFVPLFLIRFAHKNAGRGSSAQRVPDSAVRIFSGPTKYKKHKAFALCLIFCGPEKIRTPCLLSANEALYQVSYWPK